MPWKETCTVVQREDFIEAFGAKSMPFSALCESVGISRKTGYKWLDRYHEGGVAGLADRSRAPRQVPWALSHEIARKLIALREKRPSWGPRKMLAYLKSHEPDLGLPAASTVGELLKREGLVKSRRRRRWPAGATPTGLKQPKAPNDCWAVDFKGQFVVDHDYCWPLTTSDLFSRFLLGCTGLRSTDARGVKPLFERLFQEYGLPKAIRSDNGVPFSTTALGGLSRLAVWWVRLGIRPERIPPGQPQHNGCHERMHRTMKAEACKPAESTLEAQQRRFDAFRLDFNIDRPHEALGNEMPAAVYEPSQRCYPAKLSELEYPDHFALRRVRHDGGIRLLKQEVYLSKPLIDEVVGLEEMDDQLWHLHFGPLFLGILDGRGSKLRLIPAARA
jgi:transposase InsO family protein